MTLIQVALKNGATVGYFSGIKLEQFMVTNKITSYSIAREYIKEAKVTFAKIVESDAMDTDSQITTGKLSASYNRKERRMDVSHTITRKGAAVAGNVLHDAAVAQFMQKQQDRHALTEAQAMAFRELHKAKFEASKRLAVMRKEREEQEAAAQAELRKQVEAEAIQFRAEVAAGPQLEAERLAAA